MKHLLTALILLTLCTPARAADAHLVINEVQVAGSTADDEFIELYNPTDAPVSIGTWSIQYKSATGSTFSKKNFPTDAVVPAHGHFLIGGKSFAGVPTANMMQSTFSLAGSGGNIFLVATQSALTSSIDTAIVDRIGYGTATDGEGVAAPAPTAGSSIARTDATDTDDNAADFAVGLPTPESSAVTPAVSPTPPPTPAPTPPPPTPEPTPLSPNPSPTTTGPARVIINEFVPVPDDGANEWIELYNDSTYAIDLTEWTLADGTGKTIVTLDGILLPNGFKTIELSSARLNNAGDLITLRDNLKRETDTVVYGDWNTEDTAAPAPDEGQSTARKTDGLDTDRDSSDFAVTTTPTPNTNNLMTAPIQSPKEHDTGSVATTPKVSTKAQSSQSDVLKRVEALLKEQLGELATKLSAETIIVIENLTVQVNEPSSNKTTATKTTTAKAPLPSVTGTVIAKPGELWSGNAVIMTDEGAIQLHLPPRSTLTFQHGQMLRASGPWSTAKTIPIPRLLVKKDADVIQTGEAQPITPTPIAISAAPDHVGDLVEVSGTVVEKQSTRIRLAEGTASVVMSIEKQSTVEKGDVVTARGLLTKETDEYKLYRLGADPITIAPRPEAPTRNPLTRRLMPYAIALAPAGILSTAIFIGQRTKKKGGDHDGRGQEETTVP